MRDDSVLAAIDAALAHPSFCGCGSNLTIVVRGDAVWLECAAFARPSRLPASVASAVRLVLHDRQFVVDGAEAESPAPVPADLRVAAGRA